jgi:hypothetical protein
VIWVPEGDGMDVARDPPTFDSIADFFTEYGAQPLEESQAPELKSFDQADLPI